jgi:hypothetical protein
MIGKLKESAFTRDRMLPFKKMIMIIVNLARKTLQLELNMFTKNLNCKDVSKQAFSKARKNLNPKVFGLLNEKFLSEFYTDNDIKTLHGYRIFAVDGLKIQLPFSKEIVQEYGCSGNQFGAAIPMAQTSTLFDVLNKLTIHSIIAPNNTSERSLAQTHINQLRIIDKQTEFDKTGIKDLILFDRGYPATELFINLAKEKKDFLMRCKSSFCTEIRDVIAKGKTDTIIEIDIAKKRICANSTLGLRLLEIDENAKLKLRVLVFELSSGELEVLITSLIDQNKFTREILFEFYNLRWGTEENNKFHKSIAQLENFSGKSKVAVEQDYYATIFTCNIESILAQEVLEEVNAVLKDKGLKYEYTVNKNIALGSIKDELIYVLLAGVGFDEFCNEIKERMAHSLVPIRKNRSFTRHNKSPYRKYSMNNRSCL